MEALHKVNNLEELEICFNIRKEVFVDEQGFLIEDEIDDFDIIDDNKVLHFYLTKNNKPAGCCRIILTPEYIKIGRVAVLKKFRRQGIALKMIKLVEDYIGPGNYYLEAQTYVKKLYSDAGYTEIGEPFFEECENINGPVEHIKMVKNV